MGTSRRIRAPFFVVTELSGGNLLLNADGGAGGVDARADFPTRGADRILEFDESLTQDFVNRFASAARISASSSMSGGNQYVVKR
jgi:hypothetical protein